MSINEKNSDQFLNQVVNERSGRVAIAVPTNSTVTDDGAIVRRVNLIRPTSNEKMSIEQFHVSTWQEIGSSGFRVLIFVMN